MRLFYHAKEEHHLAFDQNSSNSCYDESPKDMYRRVYFVIADKLKGEIECRYNSPTFALYAKVELILKKVATGESIPPEVLSEVLQHFGDDLQRDEQTTELGMLKNALVGIEYTIDNMKEKLQKYQEFLSRLLLLLLVMPATSATSERSFSSLHHIKNLSKNNYETGKVKSSHDVVHSYR